MSARQPRLALVTGASSGIGLELARIIAEGGADVVLSARREQRLRDLATDLEQRYGITAHVLPADLAEPGAAAALAAALERQGLEVDTLVNNAGAGTLAGFLETDPERILGLIRLNVVALTALTRRLAPAMVTRGDGRILQVGSVASFLPGPRMATYYATKAFVLSLSESLAAEFAGTGVSVTALCPGPVLTGFQEAAGIPVRPHPRRAWLRNLLSTEADAVARAGYEGMIRGQAGGGAGAGQQDDRAGHAGPAKARRHGPHAACPGTEMSVREASRCRPPASRSGCWPHAPATAGRGCRPARARRPRPRGSRTRSASRR